MADRSIHMPATWPDGTRRSTGTAFDAAYLVRRAGAARPTAPVRQQEPTRPPGSTNLQKPKALDARGRRTVGLERRA